MHRSCWWFFEHKSDRSPFLYFNDYSFDFLDNIGYFKIRNFLGTAPVLLKL